MKSDRITYIGRGRCDICEKRNDSNVDIEPPGRLPPIIVCRKCLNKGLKAIKEKTTGTIYSR